MVNIIMRNRYGSDQKKPVLSKHLSHLLSYSNQNLVLQIWQILYMIRIRLKCPNSEPTLYVAFKYSALISIRILLKTGRYYAGSGSDHNIRVWIQNLYVLLFICLIRFSIRILLKKQAVITKVLGHTSHTFILLVSDVLC